MTTAIVADLHLGTTNMEDAEILIPWLEELLRKYRPRRVVFAGDTFETILAIEHGQSIGGLSTAAIVTSIIAAWERLFAILRQSNVEEFVFLNGEHDPEMHLPAVQEVLRRTFPDKRVTAGESWAQEEGGMLVVHGHQFDYNRVFWRDGMRITCVDGLTRAINALLAQSPDVEARLRAAAGKGAYSYWYAFGELPGFIRAVEKIFNTDSRLYEFACARVFRGGELNRWLTQQSGLLTRICGHMVKLVSLYPPLLLRLYDKFYDLLDLHVKWRMKKVLIGDVYPDEPDELKVRGGVKNLITGHFHDSRAWNFCGKSCYSIGCPRLSVGAIQHEGLKMFRDFDHVLIDGTNVTFHHERWNKTVPIAEYAAAD